MKKTIGILALQGGFEAHRKMLEERLSTPAHMIRTVEDLAAADALILPGGESTAIGKLMSRCGLDTAIQERVAAGMPVYGTCAGMILLAKTIEGHSEQSSLGLMDIAVARNAFGRQIDSFEADIPLQRGAGQEPGSVRGVFIRAPYVTEAAPGVEILARFQDKIVAVRQGNRLATAFHPELTDDPRLHEYFLASLTD